MRWVPSVTRSVDPAGELQVAVGHPLADEYLQGSELLILPARKVQHPDREALSERYDQFRSAG